MASLNSTAQKLKKEKSLLTKIRRSREREFKKVQAISRKYSSSLTSVQKRIDSYREQVENIGQILNQKIIQLEIPTGNPLLIRFEENLKVQDYKYLDIKRSKKIIFNV